MYMSECECVLCRNYGLGDTEIHMEMKMLKHQKSEFLMRVGKHEAKVGVSGEVTSPRLWRWHVQLEMRL